MADSATSPEHQRYIIETRPAQPGQEFRFYGHSANLQIAQAAALTLSSQYVLARYVDTKTGAEGYAANDRTERFSGFQFVGAWRDDERAIVLDHFHSGKFSKLNKGVILNNTWYYSMYDFLNALLQGA